MTTPRPRGRRRPSPMRVAALVAALAIALSAVPVQAQQAQTFTAPFDLGPQAGDQYNYVDIDGESGRVTILRAYPGPTVLSCPGKSGMATFRVVTEVDQGGPVTLSWSDALTDSYTFLTLTVRDAAGTYLASGEVRGPVLEAGSLEVVVPPFPEEDEGPHPLTIDFGMKVASACPMVDGGTATIAALEVG